MTLYGLDGNLLFAESVMTALAVRIISGPFRELLPLALTPPWF